MAIIDVYNKARNVTYVYDSVSYWDKELKQPRSKRKLIGKRDAEGNIIPTGKRGRKKAETEGQKKPSDSDTGYRSKYEQSLEIIAEKDAQILELKQNLAEAQRENRSLRRVIEQSRLLFKKALQEN